MLSPAAIQVESLSHRYGDRTALREVSFEVPPGVIFSLLGPNGGGKTTLFRILCTWMRPSSGSARIAGYDLAAEPDRVRRLIGVVFQSASLDARLTVRENLLHQGHLYGLTGQALTARMEEMLTRFQLTDRAGDRVGTLSGGLARRVDLAKGLLHRPRVLLLDEPSTGLDPKVRRDLWQYLDAIRRQEQLTVLMTTHFMDEADRCDTVGIIDNGRLVAIDSPQQLKGRIAGECLTLEAQEPAELAGAIQTRFNLPAAALHGQVRIERERAHELIGPLMEAFPRQIQSVSVSRPTLEEVFIHHTGHRFEDVGNGND